jgi:septal ring factor EnvC (AmiA/AmiB activator)
MRKRQLSWLTEESYNQLPEVLREQKLEYQRLTIKIKRREKSLKRRYEDYKKDKEELREWKKRQTEQFSELIDLHKEYVPTISITFSHRRKKWGEVNKSWSITMKYGGRVFNIYIGTDKNVRIQLNKLTRTQDYYYTNELKYITSSESDKKRISKIIKGYIQPNILKRLRDLNEDYNGFDSWCELYKNKKLKGMDFLTEIPS